jgi:hypothetical protein
MAMLERYISLKNDPPLKSAMLQKNNNFCSAVMSVRKPQLPFMPLHKWDYLISLN